MLFKLKVVIVISMLKFCIVVSTLIKFVLLLIVEF